MKANKFKPDTTNPVVNESSKDEEEVRYTRIKLDKEHRIVPVVEFAFHDRLPDGSCFGPEVCSVDEIWQQGIGCNVQPVSNTVRILIRPDVSKTDVKKILRKAIEIIDKDRTDWPQETDNFLNNWKKEIEAKRRNKDISDIEAA